MNCTRQYSSRLIFAGVSFLLFLMTASTSFGQWTTSGADIYKSNTAGNVGIGTTNPVAKLHLAGDNLEFGFSTTAFGDTNLYGRFGYNAAFTQYITSNATWNGSQWNFVNPSGYGGVATRLINSGGIFQFDTANNGANPVSWSTRVFIQNGGNVGIGTASPAATLDVNGSVNVSGNIAAKYQDVAEWVPASETMEPGTVVVLNPEKSNQVMPAGRAYDTTVAGVVSSNPGLILGESSASKAQIATSGRVLVKVSAIGQPIKIGDLLVTSEKPGMAMRSEPIKIGGRSFHQPGTIIGKALEPLADGEGKILVLLSLQ
jgi:hypothetical protein